MTFDLFVLFPEDGRQRCFCHGNGSQAEYELPELEIGCLDWPASNRSYD